MGRRSVGVLDAGLLDEMLDDPRLCSFDAALAVKSLVRYPEYSRASFRMQTS